MGKKTKKTKPDTGLEDDDEIVIDDEALEALEENSDASGDGEASDDVAGEENGSQEILIFNRWSTDVETTDKGLERYLNLREVNVPHFSGQFSRKRFWKSKYSVVERLANRLMNPGAISGRIKGRKSSNRSGKKTKILNIMRRAFELLNLKTGENPIQLLVNAIENSAPREDTTRISMGGISYQSSVDVAPQRRLDMAIHFLAMGAAKRSYNSPLTIDECLTEEILAAARGDQGSFAVSRKEEKERIAFSAR